MGGWSVAEQGTATRAFAAAVQDHAERTFLDLGGERHTYRDVDARTLGLAHGLAEEAVTAGDTVATMFDNHVDAVAAWLALNRLGAVNVPVNTALKGGFLRHVLADAGARVVLCDAAYAPRVAAVAAEVPALEVVVVRGGVPAPDGLGSARLVTRALDELITDERAPLPDRNRPADLTCLIYTAGTTGPSKGCMISHNYACNLARHSLRGTGRQADEVAWTPLPLFHLNATAASVLATMLLGGTVAIADRFSVSRFWPEIERSGARLAMLLGAMIPLIARAPDSPESQACHGQLRHVSGAPFPAELQQVFQQRFGVRTCGSNVYGLSEAAPVTSLPYGAPHPPGSSGRRNDDFDVRIVDDEDHELPPGEVGEVIVRPLKPHVMFEGYWRRPADTLAVLRNLWLHTGDYGRFDDDGFFWFEDRKKDYLRRRGENISSREVEAAFLRHPDVEEVAAHAVPSDLGEDDLKITLVVGAGSDLTEEALCRWCIDEVPYYAVPRYIEFRDELPKNAMGRVLKYQLRDEGVTPSTWDRETSRVEVPRR
ncbi:MAG: AMP-binding protein [Actinobacteria bacterium]|nr:AMP-binding protein [Actinomycetota bacterium]